MVYVCDTIWPRWHDVDRGMTMGGARVNLLGEAMRWEAMGQAWGADIRHTSRELEFMVR